MVRRQSDHDEEDFRPYRSKGGGEWLRWGLSLIIIGLLIPSLVFVVKLSNRQEATDMRVETLRRDIEAAQERAKDDRGELRHATDRLTEEIGKLREDLHQEREQRLDDRHGATFSRGKQFDK